jgi:hypothetical protein
MQDPGFMQDPDLMAEEMSAAARDGVACIVDGGHADMGRDWIFSNGSRPNPGCPSWLAAVTTRSPSTLPKSPHGMKIKLPGN